MKIAKHLQSLQPSYIREILAAATDPGVISLAGGLPADQSFPLDLMSEAIENLPGQRELFQYGQTAGYGHLLDYCRENYNHCSDDEAMICTGSQQALDLVARTYLNKGDSVAIESPGYLGALQVFAISQANIEPVDQGEKGPDLDQLTRLFSHGKIKLFYAVPDFHNPTGVCWSLETRQQVAELCQQHGVTLVEDCPYRDIRFSGTTLPLVSTFCPDRSLVLRSFSKIVAPGIRMGVINGKKEWIEPMIKVKQAADLHSNIPMQSVLLAVLQHPEFNQHVARVSRLYGERYKALSVAISGKLSQCCHFNPVEGGMFIWLKIPGSDAMEVARQAINNRVAVVPGDVFYPNGKSSQSYLRLNFSHTSVNQYYEATCRLAHIVTR